ncbi:hypothetical protein [Schnuerera ultunensis]|uniref:Core-binding (CB) domain-containing protein n=1 Tax=[Clostridium] ultunense Esp TaxID=1288971 RepID=A0A1M4PT71_9FIRM|nr:hypothetical protein [Schnuerera ultunensis]SHD78677.1 protein of unknown function [[Clostridium] ultunense Esp]
MLSRKPKLDYAPIGILSDIITQYINYKRSLGFRYGIKEGILFRFSLLSKDYELMKKEISLELLYARCMRKIGEKPSTHQSRVNTILQFCRYAESYGFKVDYRKRTIKDVLYNYRDIGMISL